MVGAIKALDVIMRTPITLLTALTLSTTACIIHARDVDPDEVVRLSSAGTIKPYEFLDAQALSKHPGARIVESGLETQYGKYIYKVELRDVRDTEWDLEIDAVTGKVFRNRQDN